MKYLSFDPHGGVLQLKNLPAAENSELAKIPSITPGVGQNIAFLLRLLPGILPF